MALIRSFLFFAMIAKPLERASGHAVRLERDTHHTLKLSTLRVRRWSSAGGFGRLPGKLIVLTVCRGEEGWKGRRG